jgi:type II secretory pathway pseudopilin PulG
MEQQSTSASPKKVVPPSAAKPKRRRGRGLFNLILLIGIIAAIALFGWAEMQRRNAISQLEATQQELEKIRESTQRRGSEVAQEVLGQVRALIDIPAEPEPTVATIIDVDALRESSEFYNKAKNGDHLIITENRAVLFDPDRGIILDVVPVSINQEEQQQIPEGGDQNQPAGNANQPGDDSTGQSQPAAEPAATAEPVGQEQPAVQPAAGN